jgi:hypothetical protein
LHLADSAGKRLSDSLRQIFFNPQDKKAFDPAKEPAPKCLEAENHAVVKFIHIKFLTEKLPEEAEEPDERVGRLVREEGTGEQKSHDGQ